MARRRTIPEAGSSDRVDYRACPSPAAFRDGGPRLYPDRSPINLTQAGTESGLYKLRGNFVRILGQSPRRRPPRELATKMPQIKGLPRPRKCVQDLARSLPGRGVVDVGPGPRACALERTWLPDGNFSARFDPRTSPQQAPPVALVLHSARPLEFLAAVSLKKLPDLYGRPRSVERISSAEEWGVFPAMVQQPVSPVAEGHALRVDEGQVAVRHPGSFTSLLNAPPGRP